MMKPNILLTIMLMNSILIMNMMTTKTSIMCMNLILYVMMTSLIISMKIKLTPIPYIVFLTMIGGLMIIFLYLAATLWTKKEMLTLKIKTMILLATMVPLIPFSTVSKSPLLNEINLFKSNFNKITTILIITLTVMLVFSIEIHMKMNSPFRRKLKIWG